MLTGAIRRFFAARLGTVAEVAPAGEGKAGTNAVQSTSVSSIERNLVPFTLGSSASARLS